MLCHFGYIIHTVRKWGTTLMSKVCLAFKKAAKEGLAIALGFISVIYTIVPDSIFSHFHFSLSDLLNGHLCLDANNWDVLFSRTIVLFGTVALCVFFCSVRLLLRKSITIKGNGYTIEVEYGDILKQANCKRVINFDECFTATVGNNVGDIKATSLCGQYLKQNSMLDIAKLINESSIKPEERKSCYKQRDRYKSGTIIQNGDDLLMAFAPLDKDGRGRFTSLKEYVDCLFTMWNELDKYYGQKDVCLTILGSGITRIGEGTDMILTQQQLLDTIIWSYILSPHKIKNPCKLKIICRKFDGFSLNAINVRA